MESVAEIKWNGWPEWNGIYGRDRLEYAVDGSTIERLDLKILFHPFKELLDLPAFFVQISDDLGIQMCCIGEKLILLAGFRISIVNKPQR